MAVEVTIIVRFDPIAPDQRDVEDTIVNDWPDAIIIAYEEEEV